MRNYSKKNYIAAFAGLVGLSFAAPPSMVHAADYSSGIQPANNRIDYGTEHHSAIRISEQDHYPVHRGVKLGQNKSTLVEVSRELRDVIVSNPEIVDAVVQSSNRVYLIGKKTGQANAFFFDTNGQQIVTLEISVEQDTGVLDAIFKRLLPGSNIKVEMLNDTVILSGSVRNPSDSNRAADIASRFVVSPAPEADTRQPRKVVNLLKVEAEEQVMLKVTVAEVERSVLKQFGINLSSQFNMGNITTGLLTANGFPLTGSSLGSAIQTGVNTTTRPFGAGCGIAGDMIPNTPMIGASGGFGSWSTGNNCIANGLKALERNGLIKTLAEPNLTAISGESAKFLAGGEFPVPVSNNNGQVGITFKEFGVSVAFTPIVMSEGRINLKIETIVSELSNAGSVQLSGFGIPGLKKREAKSTVELPSGGTLAMAGLLSDDTRKNIDGLPGLKELPVLGTLFRSQDFIKRESELVVLVTPYIVSPTSARKLARPTDGLAVASDLKSNLLGHMNRIYGKNVPANTERSLKDGHIGFIVD
ncbi:MAG: type II and III secretion system protein family protein [Hyphomicrobiaceae bacterium]